MWVYGYKATYRVTLGRVCEVEKAAEGQPRVAIRKVSQCWGVPLSSSAVFMEAPLCAGPRAAALNKWTGPRQALASSGCEAFFQELHEHLQ